MKEAMVHILQNQNLKYVFFDVFDTILLRSVHPEYTKMIWANRLSVEYPDLFNAQELYKLRNQIEAQLCEQNEIEGNDNEFKYDQFVRRLYNVFQSRGKTSLKVSYESFLKKCLDIEVDTELAVQTVDPQWIELVQNIKSNTELHVFCVSDFYLPAVAIQELFQKHGIIDYFDRIVVSSEYLLTKRSGRLFDAICREHNIEPSTVMMIGDNEISDHQVPLQKNMSAFLVDRTQERIFYDDFLKQNQFDKQELIQHRLLKIASEGRALTPFHNIIFSLFYFTVKLHQDLVRKEVKNVFFLSREGEYLKTLFDRYQEREGFEKAHKINTHYLKVSRKSTFLPSLKKLEEERFDTLFRQYRKISAYEFMASLNFEEDFIQSFESKLDIEIYKKEEDFPTSDTYRRLISDPEFRTYYEKHRSEQNQLFHKYVESLSPEFKEEGLHIVDIGWKGTIQDHIWDIFKREVYVSGYYAGLVAEGNATVGNEKKGLVFTSVPMESKYCGVFNENRAIFEIILGASHGSADRYGYSDNEVQVKTIQNDKEREIFESIVQPIQLEMLGTFEKLCDLYCLRCFDIEKDFKQFAIIHAEFVLNPRLKELTFFDQLYHYENFGFFEFTKFRMNNGKVSYSEIFRNLVRLVRNPHHFFAESFWGPITLRDKGLSFLIPVYKRYKKKKYFKGERELGGAEVRSKSMEKLLSDKEQAITNMTKMIDERDEAIKNMTAMIDDRDDAIKSMTKMIDERDDLIKKLTLRIEELEQSKAKA